MRLVWRVASVAGLAVAFVLLGVNTASADNCSSPADCADTAWTIGGAAAAAAAATAAAAAAGWLAPNGRLAREGEPPPGVGGQPLTQECIKVLTLMLDDVKRQFQTMGELGAAIESAYEKMRSVEVEYQKIRQQLENLLAGGTSTRVSGGVGFVGESVNTFGDYSTAINDEWIDAVLSKAEKAAEARRTAAAAAGAKAVRVRDHVGKVFDVAGKVGGGVSIISGVYDQAAEPGEIERHRQIGQLQVTLTATEVEIARWRRFAEQKEGQARGMLDSLRGDVARYNRRASACNAQLLDNTFDTTRLFPALARVGATGALGHPTSPVPYAVADRPMSRRAEPEHTEPNDGTCAEVIRRCQSGYLEAERQQSRHIEMRGRLRTWLRYSADIDATLKAIDYEQKLLAIELRYNLDGKLIRRELAAFATGAGLAFSGWAAVVFGLITGGGMKRAQPIETDTIARQIGSNKAVRRQIELKRVGVTREIERIKRILTRLEEGSSDYESSYREAWYRCPEQARGLPEFPHLDDSWRVGFETPPGRPRYYKEIQSWF